MKRYVIATLIIGTTCLSAVLYKNSKALKKMEKQFQFVPSGKVIVDDDTLSVQSFKMLDHEVTNEEYRAFIEDIEENNADLLSKIKVDQRGWGKRFPEGNLKPMDELYFSHEAYNEYPVVNISQFAAKEYCKWLSKKLSKNRNEGEKLIVRLPKRAEFIRAGAGSNLGFQYSWGNSYLQNSEGHWLCNFTRIPQAGLSGTDEGFKLNDYKRSNSADKNESTYTAKTRSYFPSEYDLYNLNGNVAEWLNDDHLAAGGSWYDYGYDVRLQSVKKVQSSSPEVGFRPVFTVVKK